MKTIIAPTDFSSASDNACLYAASLAADINAQLVLLHTMEVPLIAVEFPASGDLFNEPDVEKELEALKEKLSVATNNKIDIEIKNIIGSPEYEIKELCETAKPFTVVMGTHSYGIFDRFLGSTTVYTAKHLRYPVVVVPHNIAYKPIKKIALASDLQDVYDVPVQEIESIVKLFNAEFEIFYAGKDEETINRHAVRSLLLDHRLLDLKSQFYFVEDKDILKGVTSIAKEHNVGLLIMIPKKHGPFHKSQLRDFILYSDVPVMAIHEGDPEQVL